MLFSTRRRFLIAGGSLAGLAGCTSVLSESAQDRIVLAGVLLQNYSDEPRVFDVVVEVEGEVVHWDAHEISEPTYSGEARGQRSFEVDMDEPGTVTLRGRVDDQQVHVDFTEDPSLAELAGECVLGVLSYDQRDEGQLRANPRAAPESNCPGLADGD